MAWVTSTEIMEKRVWEYPRISSASFFYFFPFLYFVYSQKMCMCLCVCVYMCKSEDKV